MGEPLCGVTCIRYGNIGEPVCKGIAAGCTGRSAARPAAEPER